MKFFSIELPKFCIQNNNGSQLNDQQKKNLLNQIFQSEKMA
jgi:hypothetical protein